MLREIQIPYFFDQTLRLLLFLLLIFVWLLFKGGYYSRGHSFSWKSAVINGSWIRYVRAIQWQLLDAVSSMCSLSFLLSGVEMSCTTQTVLALACIACIHVHVPRILATATIWGWCLLHSELPIVRLLFEGGIYSRKYGMYSSLSHLIG